MPNRFDPADATQPQAASPPRPSPEWRALIALLLLPLLAHLPALSGHFAFDPLALVSGLTENTWHSNGWLAGFPWQDANAGVTTEALGALAAHSWLHGELPWWNPYSGIGMPLAAEGQTPAFFLPFVLLLALPHGLLALRISLVALSGLFTFALLRRLRLDNLPAFAGAAFFELNGTFAWFAHGPILPIAFLPLTLLGLEHARTNRFPLCITAGVAFSFLAGFPETAALNMLLAAAWATLRAAQADAKFAYLLRITTAAAAGLLLAAPAIWPFLAALPHDFVGEHAGLATGSWARANLAQALFPTLLANPQAAAAPPAMVQNAWNRAGGYLPLPILVLALAALQRTGPDPALRATLAGFVALTAARAAGLPAAMTVFGLAPLLRQAAIHTYIWPSWSMAAATLAAFTLHDWRQRRRPAVALAALLAASLCIIALWLAAPAIAWLRHAPPPFYHPLRDIALGLGLAAILLALLRAAPGRAAQALAVALPCGQSLALSAFWLLAGPHGRTLDLPAIAFLQAHAGLARVVSFGPLVPNYGAMFGIAELNYNALPVPAAWVAAVHARLDPASNGILLYDGTLPPAARLRTFLPAAEAMAVAYALTWPGQSLPGATRVYADATLEIWRLPTTSPYEEAPGCTLHPNGRLRLTAICAAPARLLRRELFDAGWRATVNSHPAPVMQSDLFQSVSLPAGVSEVTFDYTPR